jgi:hypothetical protein
MCALVLGLSESLSDLSCVNRTFATALIQFKRTLHDQPGKRPPEIDVCYPCILTMPSMGSQFEHICGYTSKGLVAIGKSQINFYVDKISRKINVNQMSAHDWRNFAVFMFNLYLVQPTSEFFNSAMAAHSQIVREDYELLIYGVQKAASRLITLCRLGIVSQSPAIDRSIQVHGAIFTPDHIEVWQFWLQQLVELARVPWFCDMVIALFRQMSHRSSLYARKDYQKSLDDAMGMEHPLVQVRKM